MAHVQRERVSIECYWNRGFVSQLQTIENAILPIVDTKSYTNWVTIVLRLGYDWGPIGYQLVPNWASFTTKWLNRQRAILLLFFLQNYLYTFHALDDTFVGLIFVEGFTVGLK